MSIPFYGGLNGQSFEIKETFNTYVDIIRDLGYGWNSPIGVGEYILINYGKPNPDPSSPYSQHLAADSSTNENWNGTIWQKIYDEDASTETEKDKGYIARPETANGLGYKLLYYSTGITPQIKFVENITELDHKTTASNYPHISGVSEDLLPDIATFQLFLPKAQSLARGNVSYKELHNPEGQEPESVDYPEIDSHFDDNDTENIVLFDFTLPKPQRIKSSVVLDENVDYNETPAAYLQETDGSYTEPQLHLALRAMPQFTNDAQHLVKRIIDTINMTEDVPDVTLTYAEADTKHEFPILTFTLPHAQIWQNVDFEWTKPSDLPRVQQKYQDEGHNEPYLEMRLPRAVNYYYGDRLAEKTNHPGESRANYDPNIKVEDYYINTTFGFIHQVFAINTENQTIDFVYRACLQAPLPKLQPYSVSTFNDDGTPRHTNITYDQPTSQTGWTVTINSPQTPDAAQTHEFVAPESGEETVTVTKGTDAGVANNSTVQFNFKIPRGPRFFIGIGVDDTHTETVIANAGKGDYYINNGGAGNTSAGHIYKWNGTAWVIQEGFGLQGPAGEALNVIATETITDTEVAADTLQDVGAYLTNTLHYAPAPNQLISVIYRDTSINDDKAYWYYRPGVQSDTSRSWARSNLTGGIGSFVERSYSPDGEKVYNTTYVNSLLVASPSDKDKQSYNATQIDVLIANLTQQITNLEAALAKDIAEQEQWGKIRNLIETTNTDEP